MKSNRRLIHLIAVLSFGVIPFLVIAETVIQQPQLGYTLTLPEGWEQIPNKAIQEQTRAVTATTGGQISQQYQDGFQQSAGGGWFQYPYVLVESRETGRVPEGQLARMKSMRPEMQNGLDSVSKKLNSIMSNMSLGETYYDATNKCILVRITMKVANVGEVEALTCGFLTEKGILTFHCYSTAAEFDKLLPVFQGLLKSVRLSDGLRYQPRLSDSIGFDFGRVGRSAFIGGAVGGLVGVAVWLKKKLQSKGSHPTEPPPLP